MRNLTLTFAGNAADDSLTFDRQAAVTFAVSKDARTITGLAVPYGVVGNNGYGSYRFTKGSLDWSKVKYLTHHDWEQAVGTVEFEETDEGLLMTAKIARGSRGDEVLALTEAGVYDGLSIGLSNDSRFEQDDDGVFNCLSGTVLEVSGTPIPAFKDAQVRSVAASAAQSKENIRMKCNKCGKAHADGIVECQAAPTADVFSAEQGASLATKVDELTKKIDGLADIKVPITGGPQLQVKHEPIYRFSGTIPGKHDFAADVIASVHGDGEAGKRVMQFMGESLLTPEGLNFVDTGDTAPVNPARYRPDMFLDEGPAQPTPLYTFFYKGGLSDVTPFFYSKLDAYSGLLADHTEGTEPAAGTFATETGATVTPKPISGKIHITREVHDQGGNPQVSGLVWSKFQRVFRQMLETKTAAAVAAGAASYAPFATIAAGATGKVAGAALEGGVVDLQFLADGSRFRKAFGHVDLYKALIAAEDTSGRKLYPIINPTNANGQAASLFGHINVGGLNIDPTWSLGPTSANASNSYVADPSAVHVWNSGLTKLEKLNEDVEGYDIGAWAYVATHLYDATGIRKVAYDPTA